VTDEPTVFAFGEFEADEALRELRRAGRPVELQATPLRLLLYLLRNRDRVISKDELPLHSKRSGAPSATLARSSG
jgi:DNA-binding winged helix-turn-helix (wHTH) protein